MVGGAYVAALFAAVYAALASGAQAEETPHPARDG